MYIIFSEPVSEWCVPGKDDKFLFSTLLCIRLEKVSSTIAMLELKCFVKLYKYNKPSFDTRIIKIYNNLYNTRRSVFVSSMLRNLYLQACQNAS